MNLLLKIAIAALATGVILVGGALLFAARPTVLIGVNADALSHSVQDSSGKCSENVEGEWICAIGNRQSVTRYRVDVGWSGCWDGERLAGPVTDLTPEKISGCIDIWDHLRLEDAINGD